MVVILRPLDEGHGKHKTLDKYPDKIVGITLVDEEPGYTGIYMRDENGGLWPARTVYRENKKHHKSVVDSWMSRPGENIDARSK